MGVLVLDGNERGALAITRSLGRKNVAVDVGSPYAYSTVSLSRYCRQRVVYPSPENNSHNFISKLFSLVKEQKYEVIYPSTEFTVIPIAYHKQELEKYTRVPVPDFKKAMLVHDKAQTLKFAGAQKIPCPKSFLVGDIEQLYALSKQLDYPVVVKPRSKVVWNNYRPIMLKVTSQNYVSNSEKLVQKCVQIYKASGMFPMIQEYIPGEGLGVEVLFNHGEPRAVFMHRRIREYPISGGASTLRESIYDEDLKNLTFELLGKLKWHGVAMVEFKRDRRDGIPKLMEVNGRFWGSLALSIASGVDFPYLLHKMITEGDIEPVFDYQTGIKCRWLVPGDILWFGSSLKQRSNRLSILREFFDFRGQHDDIWSINDPLPALGALLDVARLTGEVIKGRRSISGEFKSKE